MGAEEAVQTGQVSIKDYKNLRISTDLFRLNTQERFQSDIVRGTWIKAETGVGKTHYARAHFGDYYVKPQSKWFDGYKGEDAIVLDDLDMNGGQCLGHYLKIWADKWFCTGETKGGTIPLNHKHFVVTSQYSIRDIFGPDSDEPLRTKRAKEKLVDAIERRFNVIELDEQYWL